MPLAIHPMDPAFPIDTQLAVEASPVVLIITCRRPISQKIVAVSR
jgi:hypothetical protein